MSPAGATTIYGDLDVEVELNAPIGADSWFATGGTADTLVHPANPEVLAEIMRRCRRTETPLRVLGDGANLLVSDQGVDGIVVKLDADAFSKVSFNAEGELYLLEAGAGVKMSALIKDAERRGLAGLAHMAGIPASVGGAIRMNAGGRYGAIGDTIHSVRCLARNGETRVYLGEELRFEYRSTNIPDPVILSAVFNVEQQDPLKLRKQLIEIYTYKKSTQPLGDKSAGCMFRNPIDPDTGERVSAGAIIDRCGLKGLRVGSAEVSTLHANFIAIDRGGRADDAIELSRLVAQRVKEERGITIEREVVIWNREDDSTSI